MPEPKPDPFIARAFAAVPDAITSGAFFCAWIAPATIGYQRVRDLMLLMLIEFIVMHSGGFTAGILSAENVSRSKRALSLAGLTMFYMLFVLAFSLAFSSTWPIWGFLWLFVSRFLQLFTSRAETDVKMQRMLGAWIVSVLTYLGGAFFTAFVPLPALGITPEVISALHLQGSGLWIEQPWTVIAFGAFYFAVLAWSKFRPFVPDKSVRFTRNPR
jgi:hypothetical protein